MWVYTAGVHVHPSHNIMKSKYTIAVISLLFCRILWYIWLRTVLYIQYISPFSHILYLQAQAEVPCVHVLNGIFIREDHLQQAQQIIRMEPPLFSPDFSTHPRRPSGRRLNALIKHLLRSIWPGNSWASITLPSLLKQPNQPKQQPFNEDRLRAVNRKLYIFAAEH